MKQKVTMYVYNCYYGIRCLDKKDIDRIINEVIQDNPNETDFVKLGVKVKRRLASEL